MKKRVLSLALAAAMAASLTACSGNSTTTETTAAVEETKAAENANTESKEADGSGVDVSDWKNKTVTCIVPYDAGGGTDTVMRALADAAKGSFKIRGSNLWRIYFRDPFTYTGYTGLCCNRY